jgi:RND superfamily putative drug exporter
MKFADGAFDVPGTNSSEAMATMEKKFGEQEQSPSLQLVIESSTGPVSDHVAEIDAAIEKLERQPFVDAVSSPFDPAMPYISEDLSTAVATVSFYTMETSEAESAATGVDDVAASLQASGDLTVEVGGSLAGGVPDILGPSEIVGAAIAFIVLLITFGSLVAAGANMLGALLGVGVGVLGILAFSAISPIGSVTPILAVMLGLAVGIDYALFILSRFRSELRSGIDTEAAIGRATGTAGSAVVFAGATVIIALVGLTVVGIPFIGEMGLAAAFAVAVAVLMSLTLLPAFLGAMGRRALPRKLRVRTNNPVATAPKWTTRWIDSILRRPWRALLSTSAVLLIIATPVLSMQTSLAIPGGEDPQSSQRAAYDLIADKFGDGAQDPLIALISSSADLDAALSDAVDEISEFDDVATVIPSGVSDDGTVGLLTVLAESGPLDPETTQLVRDIRAITIDDATISVTGATAMGLDSDEQLRNALVTYVILIAGLALFLLILLFRSILVPVIATVGFLLSLGAGLGATVAVFQWGWLDAVISAPQGNPLLTLLPIVVTGILFGLAMDYEVFLVSRIHEAYQKGQSPVSAIREGFLHSAPVVVAAALIMAAVFGGFALSHSSLVGSIALALAVGVLADALLVRMVLMPALLALLGNAAWWNPAWLDKVLPTIDVEGHSLDLPQASDDMETDLIQTAR